MSFPLSVRSAYTARQMMRDRRRSRWLASTLFVLGMSACGNFGGCGACGSAGDLPPGGLPADQTLEGGAQIRVTRTGFDKLTSIIPGVIDGALSNGFCLPSNTVGVGAFGISLASATYCPTDAGNGCNPGCQVNVDVNTTTVEITPDSLVRIAVSTSISTAIPIDFRGPLGVFLGSCTLGVTSDNLAGSFDIALGIKPSNGELDIHLAGVNDFNLGLQFDGCSVISDIANLAADLIDAIPDIIYDILTPLIDPLIQGFLPDPLGIASLVDAGALLEGISPGTEALLETRIVPGGYVRVDGPKRALSLGVITGFNADRDIATRTGTRPDGVPYASEPSLCVPPIARPNFGAPPASLPITARQTFRLDAAGAFDGVPEPMADLAMGVSETFLDLTGHHLVTSGGMCLGVGTELIEQLNLATVGLLVPSLADLASPGGKDPLLLVTRPQNPLDFKIGDNTMASPALTVKIEHLEVDFYAFLYERYVRAFTLDLTMNVGLNLEFEHMPGQPAVLKPTLVGLSAAEVQVKVLNSQFVRETPAHLEMVLPSVFNLVTSLLGNIPPVEIPTFGGFALDNLSIQRVTTSQDDFLALYATLGASQMMRQLSETNPFTRAVVAELDKSIDAPQPQSTGRAQHLSTFVPPPDRVRSALLGVEGGAMPTVEMSVDRFDDAGRELEWTYNIDGGLYRPFRTSSDGRLSISDPAFAWQGKYRIGLKSRVKGDYRTTSYEAVTPVIIDSVGPNVILQDMVWDDATLRIPLYDVVSEHTVEYAFGKPGDDAPRSAWTKGGFAEITRDAAEGYAVDGAILVFARDEAGNVSIAYSAPFHGQGGSSSCGGCASSSSPAGGFALAILVGAFVLRRRRAWTIRLPRRIAGVHPSTFALWLVAATAGSMIPACSCDNAPAKACEVAADCGPSFCLPGELPYCIEGECVCGEDIVPGRIGPYSDVATGVDGSIWVSAYAQSHGDLVVARVEPGRVPNESWEWVDGVPEGPVTIPDSKLRRGIEAKGPDVGMYTSIAVSPSGVPMVTYFERDNGSLRFAAKVGDSWQIHVVQQGTGANLGELGEHAGLYTSLSLRTDDGRPGVAYLAHVMDANGGRAEVRYAAAQVPVPTQASDWQIWVVDTAPIPPADPENPNIYPLPSGLGLFVDAARLPNQAPVVVYYDRANGDLKLAKFAPATGQFATPVVLDGVDVDAGWSPSVAVDTMGVVHVAYVGSTKDDLKYVTDAPNAKPEIVDDGYRIVGTTPDGRPKPEFHFVGDDASLQLAGGRTPFIAYQDATTQELLLATKTNGTWQRISVAGALDPWPGGYGFFASSSVRSTDLVMSTWVINQPAQDPLDNNWVEILTRPTVIQ